MSTESMQTTESIWNRMSGRLRRFIRSRTNCDADADDVVQDVFVRVHEKLGSLRDADRVESWLFQIARNALTDVQRKQSRLVSTAHEEIPQPTDDDQQLNEVMAEWLRNLISQLPTDQRRAVEMYEFHGMSQADIADGEGVSLSGAKSRIQRGRRRIVEMMRDCCELQFDGRGNLLGCEPQPGQPCRKECGCDSD